MVINPLFHPYAGIIRIRLEGIISARTRRHPLKSAAKVVKISEKPKKIKIFFSFSEREYLRVHKLLSFYCWLFFPANSSISLIALSSERISREKT